MRIKRSAEQCDQIFFLVDVVEIRYMTEGVNIHTQ